MNPKADSFKKKMTALLDLPDPTIDVAKAILFEAGLDIQYENGIKIIDIAEDRIVISFPPRVNANTALQYLILHAHDLIESDQKIQCIKCKMITNEKWIKTDCPKCIDKDGEWKGRWVRL
jgi:hypothetical protein